MKSFIHLIRHGTTEGNQKGLYYGHSDLPLADEGVDLIKSLNGAGVYPKPEKAVYYSSGLARAEQTLSLIYGEVPRIRLDALKEMSFGDFELKTHSKLKSDPRYISWINDSSGNSAPPGGESANRFAERVKAGFESVLESHLKAGYGAGGNAGESGGGPDSDIENHSVVVCHGGVICVIMHSYFDDYRDNMFKWIPDPGHGYTIIVEAGRPAGYITF